MTAKEVYAGKLKVGDRVRVKSTGEEYEVTDLFSASVDGTHLTVHDTDQRFPDFSDLSANGCRKFRHDGYIRMGS